MASRFVVGIDLGTTNCALAAVDTGTDGHPKPVPFAIPQVVRAGVLEPRPLLPSFLYLPGTGEQPAGALKLPWAPNAEETQGEFARDFGSQVPTRMVSSAKSWLGHSGIDRKGAFLPLRAPEGGKKVSPVEAATRYLKHLAGAWNEGMAKDLPAHRLEVQDIILTVPASFDVVAKDLTVEAARAAGFEHLTLLEEPQAAFYAWLDTLGDKWREEVQVGDLVLVADVGGGTSDFTLIEVGEDGGNLSLTRLAVGEHLLLGGDNMDLTLAHFCAQALAAKGTKLDAGQMLQLTHAARQAKELLFSNPALTHAPVTVLGKGRSVVGGSIKYELSREDAEKVLIEGFFPEVAKDTVPATARTMGLQELGLPYVADAAITKHLALFLARQAEALSNRERPGNKKKKANTLPTAVLFNGGVFKSPAFRERLLSVLNNWAKAAKSEPIRALSGADLDLAVARGAAYYGNVRRGKGVRIRGGTARAYYIGVESNMPAIPGYTPPLKALCVAPFGMEEGTETDIPGYEVGLAVGEEAEFRFLGSSVRREDAPGAIVEEWTEQIEELTPIHVTLDGKPQMGRVVPVHLHTKVTEVGQLELWCYAKDGKQRWKLAFDARQGR